MVKKNVSLVHIHNKLLKFRKIKCNELCGIQRFSCKCPCSQFILIYKEKEIGMSDFIFLNGELSVTESRESRATLYSTYLHYVLQDHYSVMYD